MIRYSLAGFVMQRVLVTTLIEVLEQVPDLKRTGIAIDNVFDSFPNIIFNSGRLNLGYPYSKKKMESAIHYYNSRGIGIRYTYSNALIREKHLRDYEANLTLELAHNEMNSITVNNPILEDYIRKHYPKYKIVGSCTAVNRDIEWLKKRQQEVDILVLPPELNLEFDILKELDSKKIELLMTESCLVNCPYKKEHYLTMGRAQIDRDPSYLEHIHNDLCPLRSKDKIKREVWKKSNLDYLEKYNYVEEINQKTGINLFKVGERDLLDPEDGSYMFGEFLIKKERLANFYEYFWEKYFLKTKERAW